MIKKKKFDEQYVKDCLKLVREEFPDAWKRLDDHETGRQPIATREEYGAVWQPVRTYLFNGGYSDGSTSKLTDLCVEMSFENRRQLGLE